MTNAFKTGIILTTIIILPLKLLEPLRNRKWRKIPRIPGFERGAEGARQARLKPPNLSGKRTDLKPMHGLLPVSVV